MMLLVFVSMEQWLILNKYYKTALDYLPFPLLFVLVQGISDKNSWISTYEALFLSETHPIDK